MHIFMPNSNEQINYYKFIQTLKIFTIMYQ